MSNIGSTFALQGEAPADWNLPGLLPDTQVAFRTAAGQGYVLEVFVKSFREKLLQGAQAWVYTAHIVREDADILFAFETPGERTLFMELRDIDSIGPKTAAQVLGGLSPQNLSDLAHGRSLAGVKIPGVGPKTIDKLALGVKSKREKFLLLLNALGVKPVSGGADRIEEVPFAIVQALEKLGLRRDDVVRTYRDVATQRPDLGAQPPADIIRLLLQRWGQYKSKLTPVEGNA